MKTYTSFQVMLHENMRTYTEPEKNVQIYPLFINIVYVCVAGVVKLNVSRDVIQCSET